MARVVIKVGDIFSVDLKDGSKKYFQYITNDRTQLNADVIRGFSKSYPKDVSPNISDIINDDVIFYAHCITKLGVKMGAWEILGNSSSIGNLPNIVFRGAIDYARKAGEEPVKISSKWYVWHINDNDFTHIGKLTGEYKKADIGLIINPYGIIELLKGNKYPDNYPE